MYTTIEADIENGKIIGSEVASIPNHAHVLITLLSSGENIKRPALGTVTSEKIEMSKDALSPMTDDELEEWGM